MSTTIEAVTARLKELHLPTVRECFTDAADRARRESLSYEEYLLDLLELETQERMNNRTQRFLRESKLPLEKTFATFDHARLPAPVMQKVRALTDGSFLDRRENVLAFGTPGSGKSHLVCALGNELIHAGRRILFTTCALLVEDLLCAKKELRLDRALKRLSKYDGIIIDDIGYVQQGRDEMEVLFCLLADRYERASIMITSNLPFSKWEQIFKDPMTTAAAIDRLVHHCVILELNISSYRLEHSKNRQDKENGGGE